MSISPPTGQQISGGTLVDGFGRSQNAGQMPVALRVGRAARASKRPYFWYVVSFYGDGERICELIGTQRESPIKILTFVSTQPDV